MKTCRDIVATQKSDNISSWSAVIYKISFRLFILIYAQRSHDATRTAYRGCIHISGSWLSTPRLSKVNLLWYYKMTYLNQQYIIFKLLCRTHFWTICHHFISYLSHHKQYYQVDYLFCVFICKKTSLSIQFWRYDVRLRQLERKSWHFSSAVCLMQAANDVWCCSYDIRPISRNKFHRRRESHKKINLNL